MPFSIDYHSVSLQNIHSEALMLLCSKPVLNEPCSMRVVRSGVRMNGIKIFVVIPAVILL